MCGMPLRELLDLLKRQHEFFLSSLPAKWFMALVLQSPQQSVSIE
jgi:hypothetical protein